MAVCKQDKRLNEKFKRLDEVIEKYKGKEGVLITVLHEAQDIFGYLPLDVQKHVADGLGIPLSEVYGVVTFYSFFSLTPRGKYQISVCLGTACYVKGAAKILDKIKEELNVEVGGVTQDELFSLQATRCVGACGLAPVVIINDDVYGRMVPERVPEILKKYKESE
ncbi:MAG: NADP-reducing hydrogenase subunit HndA [Thermosediminibacterales bacterium]|nr:NADP-reducing hydrogenase subunit HndA [Thermosediminibacterales bacterium]